MKVLTLYQFKLLSDHEQYDLLFTQGDFLDMVIAGNSRFAVYALFKFFVEVEYNNKENMKFTFEGKEFDDETLSNECKINVSKIFLTIYYWD